MCKQCLEQEEETPYNQSILYVSGHQSSICPNKHVDSLNKSQMSIVDWCIIVFVMTQHHKTTQTWFILVSRTTAKWKYKVYGRYVQQHKQMTRLCSSVYMSTRGHRGKLHTQLPDTPLFMLIQIKAVYQLKCGFDIFVINDSLHFRPGK